MSTQSEQDQQKKQQRLQVYNSLGLPDVRRTVVQLSKLLVQAWLDEGNGLTFKKDILDNGLEVALKNQGIFFDADWIKAELDVDSFIGSIEVDESDVWKNPKVGFKLLWKIPYAPWPQNAVTKPQLEEWVQECDTWINREKYQNPDEPFPIPKSPYIPLATL